MAGLCELNANPSSRVGYEWVNHVVWSIPSKFVDSEGVRRLGSPSSWVRSGKEVKIEFLPCTTSERVCHEGPSGRWFFMYTCLLEEIGVRFPFTDFECSVLRQVNCAPSQIHPNGWGFVRAFEVLMEYLEEKPSLEVFFYLFQAKGVDRGIWVTLSSHQGRVVFSPFKASYKDFKEFYVKVRSTEDNFPFYLDEHIAERFPLYWRKRSAQCVGVEELSEKDADLVEFLFLNLKGGKVLATTELLRWDSDKESVIDYLETKVPDCNTASLKSFFKQRAEKEVSSSHVVKVEKGSEVSKPLERRRPVSLKRMRAEETSGKGVIDRYFEYLLMICRKNGLGSWKIMENKEPEQKATPRRQSQSLGMEHSVLGRILLLNAPFLIGNDNPLTWSYLGSDTLVGVLRIERFAASVIDLTEGKCCGKDVSLDEVAAFTKSQRGLHGFKGAEDLSSLWCEHYPFSIVTDEHFRSRADLELLGKVGKVATTRYMQVEAARLMCISRELEMQAMEEESSQRVNVAEFEKNLKLAREQITLKGKENELLKEENEELKEGKLESRLVELCGEKKEAETSKKAHGFEMFAAAWGRARAQAELFALGVNFDMMDPVKVVYKGKIVDDDQVPVEGNDDHDPAE
ncbi:hypothetical protein PIB30_070893 [Stylosanthes scabra]|uniref:Transposase (putative) gypsy type domain-containing protein n=1 Tax=Stylosanthes scabra TaxID=79078 RepID=A0ABU6YQ06_9FABA|nr:hypothetical protein [Stylosanthes scabra]